MSVQGLEDGFADIAYADSMLGATAKPWASTTDTNKEDALQYARVYMEKTYRDNSFDLDSDFPDYLKTCNSILANEHLSESLFESESNSKTEMGLTSKSVKADVVETKKEYDPVYSSKWKDPFPSVTAIMVVNGASLMVGGVRTVSMIRR